MLDGAHVGVEVPHVDVVEGGGAIIGEMNMGVGQPWQHGAAPQIKNLRPGAFERHDLTTGADRQNAPHLHGDGFRLTIIRIGRENAPIGQDKIWSDRCVLFSLP